jgi:putative heme-binding domain-containing protein
LADVGLRRDRQYLLRSIVLPSVDIDEKYRSQLLILDSGKIIQGLKLREEADTIVLADAEGKEVRVKLDEIDEAIEQKVSIMPEMTKTLTKREMRDLVAYLSTLKTAVKP